MPRAPLQELLSQVADAIEVKCHADDMQAHRIKFVRNHLTADAMQQKVVVHCEHDADKTLKTLALPPRTLARTSEPKNLKSL